MRFTCGLVFVLLQCSLVAQDILSENSKGATIFNPIPLCAVNGESFTGTLPDAVYGPQPDYACDQGTVENPIWFSFIPCTDDIIINITPAGCDNLEGIQAGVYESNNITPSNIENKLGIICETGVNSTFSLSYMNKKNTLNDIEPGEIYYLMIDGFNGDQCDFTVEFIQGFLDEIPSVEASALIDFSDTIKDCSSRTEFLSVNLLPLFSSETCLFQATGNFEADELYEVVITPDVVDVEERIKNKNVNTFDITFNQTYTGDLDISVRFSDSIPMINCLEDIHFVSFIDITKIDTVDKLVRYCNDVFPITTDSLTSEYTDEVYSFNSYGIYEFQFDFDTCVNVMINIAEMTADTVDMGVAYICASDCFDLGNESFCDEGVFYALTDEACNEYSRVELVYNEVISDLPDEVVLDCDDLTKSITINTQSSLDIEKIEWYNESNVLIGEGSSVSISESGIITVRYHFEGISGCYEEQSFEVEKDDGAPEFEVSDITLDCNNPVQQILIMTQDVYTSYEFSGPDLTGSDISGPLVDTPDIYTLSIVGNNGCKSSKTIEVKGDFDKPEVNLAAEQLLCSNLNPTISFESSNQYSEAIWFFQSNQIGNLENITVGEAGIYDLNIQGINGCELDTFVEVHDRRVYPLLDFNEQYTWYCSSEEIILKNGSSNSSPTKYTWEGDLDFDANNDECIVRETGTLVVTAEHISSSCITKDTINIVEEDNWISDVKFRSENPNCSDEEYGRVVLEEIVGGVEPYSYKLDGFDVLEGELNFVPLGKHTVTIIDVNGCDFEFEVEILPASPFYLWGEDVYELTYGEVAEIEIFTDLDDSEIQNIYWLDEKEEEIAWELKLEYGENKDEIISVFVENLNGCIESMDVTIRYLSDIDFIYPNIFSPNGDDINEYFSIFGTGSPHKINLLQVFDRYGGLVYEASSPSSSENPIVWDGKFNNQFVESGVYVFVIQYSIEENETLYYSGDITVIR